ncbi:MAG: zf-HC2 domain-containing protein [Nocardioides sp.]
MGVVVMMGHLGNRVSALLDGQLSREETDRAWEHVHGCHACRDRVEREGWVKTRLTGLSFDVAAPSTPDSLKGSLMGAAFAGVPGDSYLSGGSDRRRTSVGLAAIGGSAVGAAVMGVLVLGVGPASAPAPSLDRRAPVTSISQPDAARSPVPAPTRRAWISPDGTR